MIRQAQVNQSKQINLINRKRNHKQSTTQINYIRQVIQRQMIRI